MSEPIRIDPEPGTLSITMTCKRCQRRITLHVGDVDSELEVFTEMDAHDKVCKAGRS